MWRKLHQSQCTQNFLLYFPPKTKKKNYSLLSNSEIKILDYFQSTQTCENIKPLALVSSNLCSLGSPLFHWWPSLFFISAVKNYFLVKVPFSSLYDNVILFLGFCGSSILDQGSHGVDLVWFSLRRQLWTKHSTVASWFGLVLVFWMLGPFLFQMTLFLFSVLQIVVVLFGSLNLLTWQHRL